MKVDFIDSELDIAQIAITFRILAALAGTCSTREELFEAIKFISSVKIEGL